MDLGTNPLFTLKHLPRIEYRGHVTENWYSHAVFISSNKHGKHVLNRRNAARLQLQMSQLVPTGTSDFNFELSLCPVGRAGLVLRWMTTSGGDPCHGFKAE